MGFKKSKTIILLFFIFTSKLFAYDYPWEVEYEIKEPSIEEINKTVTKFIIENSEYQVYVFDRLINGEYTSAKNELEIHDSLYKLNLKKTEWIPFGKVLCGSIYLEDVGFTVYFYIPHVSGINKNFIRLVSYATYGNNIIKHDGKTIIKKGTKHTKHYFFNDVESTKLEIPIKKSFEKNFLSKLPLEWEYQEPAALDKFLSKLLTTLYRPRKNFID